MHLTMRLPRQVSINRLADKLVQLKMYYIQRCHPEVRKSGSLPESRRFESYHRKRHKVATSTWYILGSAKCNQIYISYNHFLYLYLEEKGEIEKVVEQYDKQGNYIQSFISRAAAARWLEENNYVFGHLNGVRSHIGEVCNGKRKLHIILFGRIKNKNKI